MKNFRFFAYALIFAAALSLTGCIEISTLVNVNKDGSGTLEETVLMSKEVIDMINQFQQSFTADSSKPSEQFEIYSPEELKTEALQFGDNVKYISSSKLSREGRNGYVVTYGFNDVNHIKINQNPDTRIKLEAVTEDAEAEQEFVTFSFIKGTPSELRIQMPEDKKLEHSAKDSVIAAPDSLEADTTGFFDQISSVFKGLRMSMIVKVNGQISKTNAEYQNGSTVTLLDIDFSQLLSNPEKLKQFREVDPQNLEQVKEILKGIPGIKVEFNNSVFIQF